MNGLVPILFRCSLSKTKEKNQYVVVKHSELDTRNQLEEYLFPFKNYYVNINTVS